MPSDLSSLYTEKLVVLWVEDQFTRTWFQRLWQDSDIALLVAGGTEAVFAAVNDARAEGATNVFGFRDRDFLTSNQADWQAEGTRIRVFIPEVFEVENFFLDFAGLASLGRNYNRQCRGEADLRARAHRIALSSLWWMAARSTIADARRKVTEDFPSHPRLSNPPTLNTRADAQAVLEKVLVNSKWHDRCRPGFPAWTQHGSRPGSKNMGPGSTRISLVKSGAGPGPERRSSAS